MPALLGSEGVPHPNLFTPGFGQAPHFCVGRDQMLAEIRSALNVGPEDDRFTSVLLGPRGSGKTVALGMIEDVAVEAGWVVFSLDASTDGIHGRIKEQIAWAQDQYEGLPPTDAPDRRTTTRARLRIWPVSFQREVAESVRIKWGLRRQLTTLAAHAAAQGTAVMLSVDEMHGGDRDEMRRLSADLQHIVKASQIAGCLHRGWVVGHEAHSARRQEDDVLPSRREVRHASTDALRFDALFQEDHHRRGRCLRGYGPACPRRCSGRAAVPDATLGVSRVGDFGRAVSSGG